MPIYEFYCESCHTIFNFFSRRVNTDKRPDCPRCGCKQLERQVSVFSVSKNRSEEEFDSLVGVDESRLEQAMMAMAGELAGLDENDPRQAARAVRKLMDSAGLKLGGTMEEAVHRLELGEDPGEIEATFENQLDDNDLFSVKPRKVLGAIRRKYLPPKMDQTLHDL